MNNHFNLFLPEVIHHIKHCDVDYKDTHQNRSSEEFFASIDRAIGLFGRAQIGYGI
jgi:hypothetical protein